MNELIPVLGSSDHYDGVADAQTSGGNCTKSRDQAGIVIIDVYGMERRAVIRHSCPTRPSIRKTSSPMPDHGRNFRVPLLPLTGNSFEIEQEHRYRLHWRELIRQASRTKGHPPILGNLTIKMYEANDAFKLLALLGTVANATKTVSFTGGYATTESCSSSSMGRLTMPSR